ncbi:MAG: hypothetical protein DMF12_05140 [Verrucomicrobia bacterium]|nr:MAG: hypothetical protein DMF12_05140 [Verrucomicrobiota bacterium]
MEKTYRILVVFQSAGKFSCSGIPPSHFAGPYALNQRWNQNLRYWPPPVCAFDHIASLMANANQSIM